MGPEPAAAASPGSLLEMQILELQPRPNKTELWGWGPVVYVQQAIRVFLMLTQV